MLQEGGGPAAFGRGPVPALHAEPSHPIPQIEGNNQKSTEQQDPLTHQTRSPGSPGWSGPRFRMGALSFCFWIVPGALGTQAGSSCPSLHTQNRLSLSPGVGGCGAAQGTGPRSTPKEDSHEEGLGGAPPDTQCNSPRASAWCGGPGRSLPLWGPVWADGPSPARTPPQEWVCGRGAATGLSPASLPDPLPPSSWLLPLLTAPPCSWRPHCLATSCPTTPGRIPPSLLATVIVNSNLWKPLAV